LKDFGLFTLILFCDSPYSSHFSLFNCIFVQYYPWVALSIKYLAMGTDDRGSIASRADIFSSSLRPKAWRTWHQHTCTAGFFPRESYHTRGIERIEWQNYNLYATIHTKSVTVNRPNEIFILYYLYLYLTANGFSPGGSGTTIRHNTQITHIIQNNTTIKWSTIHKIHTQWTPYTEWKYNNYNYNTQNKHPTQYENTTITTTLATRHLYLSLSAREHNQRINIILCCVMFKNCAKHCKMTLFLPLWGKRGFVN
jgi:hypothetical protein